MRGNVLERSPGLGCKPVVHIEDDHSTVERHVGKVPAQTMSLRSTEMTIIADLQ
jgi:hypothetical protein